MRLKFIAIGIVLIFIGLAIISVSQTSVTTPKEKTDIIAYGEQNDTEISATLNASDLFSVSYSGGSTYANPQDMDIIVYDPQNGATTVDYVTQKNTGIVANYTGLYRMQLMGLFVDPSRPLILTVMKIDRWTETAYPNSNMLPVGVSSAVVGTGAFIWGATSSKGRRIKSKAKKPKSS